MSQLSFIEISNELNCVTNKRYLAKLVKFKRLFVVQIHCFNY
jgi:hypothetical protein